MGWLSGDLLRPTVRLGAVRARSSLFAHAQKRLLFGELLSGRPHLLDRGGGGRGGGLGMVRRVPQPQSSDPPAVYPAMRLAVAAAIVVGAPPPVRTAADARPAGGDARGPRQRHLGGGRTVGVVAGLAAASREPPSCTCCSAPPAAGCPSTRSPRPSADLGVEATDLRYAQLEPAGSRSWSPPRPTADRCFVEDLGRDAWDGQLLTSIWSSLWNRGETPEFGGACTRWSTRRS